MDGSRVEDFRVQRAGPALLHSPPLNFTAAFRPPSAATSYHTQSYPERVGSRELLQMMPQ